MSDARLRDLERSLAAHPTPETRDRLAAERARRGDGPWLPVPYYDDAAGWRSRRPRWSRDFPIAQTAPGCFIFGGSRLDAVLVDLRPAPRGVSAFYSIREQMEAIDRAQRAAGWIDPLAEARAAADALAAAPPPTVDEVARDRGMDNARGTIRLRLEWASAEVTFGEDA